MLNKHMRLATTLAVVIGLFVTASPAFASTKHSTYGQCGPAVHNGSQLVNAWGAMNVLNSKSASQIARAAGWNPTDGGMVSYLVQRGREFKLAAPANIQDFGCKYGSMYSVGPRHYGAGEAVIAIVPAKYNPAQISGKPRKGYHKVTIWVHTVGRGNCANGFKKYVAVIAYVPNHPKKTPVKPKKPATKPAPKPKPTPPGNCNITITNSVVNGNVNDCTNITIVVVCGNVSQTFSGDKDTATQQANTWQQANCNTTTTTGCTSNCSPPPQVCTDKTASNVGGPLPCVYPPQKCTDTNATNYGGPLPCVYPPKPKPTIIDIYQLNAQSIYEGNSYQLCATISAPVAGDKITVTFMLGTPGHSGYGTLSGMIFNLTGSGTVCTTYTAPGEVTSDMYTVLATDNTQGTDATPVTSDPWNVQPLPTG